MVAAAYHQRQEQTKPDEHPTVGQLMFPGYQRHINPKLYAGFNYTAGLGAGILDGLLDIGLGTAKALLGIGQYAGYGIARGLSLQPMQDGPFKQALEQSGKKFDQINDSVSDFAGAAVEFFLEYNANPAFKALFLQQAARELKGYFTRLNGTTPEQGYAQGRLIVDVVSLLAATGGLKKLMTCWKRTGTFRLKDYLPKNPLGG